MVGTARSSLIQGWGLLLTTVDSRASLEVNEASFYKDLTPASSSQAVLICLLELALFILLNEALCILG